MTNLETLSMRSDAGEVIRCLFSDSVFNSDLVKQFRLSSSYARDIYETSALKQFVDQQFVQDRLRNQWIYESDPKWTGRTINLALRETTAHAFAHLMNDFTLELDKKRIGQFPDLDERQMEEMSLQCEFLNEYFRTFLPNR